MAFFSVLTKRTVPVAASLCLLTLLSGCGGGSPTPTAPMITPIASGVEQTFGDLRTRIVGTAQQPVVSAAPGATVIGIAGATISDITRIGGNRFLSTNKIVFSRGGGSNSGDMEIYTMNADGGSPTRLTNNANVDDYPAFSPDGTKIVYTNGDSANRDVYSMNADGSNVTRLTNNGVSDQYPSFSPDGTKIVFNSEFNGIDDVYSMNADGSNVTRLTNNTVTDEYASFSPDGTKIVFMSQRDGNNEIYTMNADGTNPTRLTNDAASDHFPSFSPDGTKIVFTSNRVRSDEIYIMNADGSNVIRLTNDDRFQISPSYSPDGASIQFTDRTLGDVYSMSTDGSNMVNLTNSTGGDFVYAKPSFGIFAYPTQKLLGTGNAAFGTVGAGFLLGQKGVTTTSLVTFDSATPATRGNVRVTAQTDADSDASNLVFVITAGDSLSNLKYYSDFTSVGVTPVNVFNATIPAGTTGAVVSFDAATGKVANVIPYAANRGAGSAKSTQTGDTLTYTGSFSGVWNEKGENIAPTGAHSVRINAKTGAMLGFE